MLREQIWSRGKLWTALVIGVPTGVLFGLFQLASSGRWGEALIAAVIFGAVFGATMSILIWSRWKAAKQLDSQDRRVVARSVFHGEPIEDARLAPAVIEYAGVIRRSHDRERRYRWTLWIWPALTLAIAVRDTIKGSTGSAVLFWGLVAFWILFMPTQRRRERKTVLHAADAEQAARGLLDR